MPTPPTDLAPAVVYRRLLNLCAPHWKMFVIAAIAMAVYAVTDTGFAFLTNNLIKFLDPEGLARAVQYRRFHDSPLLVAATVQAGDLPRLLGRGDLPAELA